jgi:hypothetical protein
MKDFGVLWIRCIASLEVADDRLLEDVGRQREENRSGLSSANHSSKREREEDHDVDMEMASNDREGSHMGREMSVQERDMSVQDHPSHREGVPASIPEREMSDQEREGNRMEENHQDPDASLPDQSAPVSMISHTELLEAPDTVPAEDVIIDEGQIDEGDIVVHRVGEDIGMDFTIPEVDAFTPAVTQ